MKALSIILLTVGFLAGHSLALAEGVVRYRALPNASKVKIEGTSTVHDWIMEGTIIGGMLDFDPAYALDPSASKAPELKSKIQAEVNIPVQSIKSGKKRMDEVMLEAMKQPEFPRIGFKLSELNPSGAERKS